MGYDTPQNYMGGFLERFMFHHGNTPEAVESTNWNRVFQRVDGFVAEMKTDPYLVKPNGSEILPGDVQMRRVERLAEILEGKLERVRDFPNDLIPKAPGEGVIHAHDYTLPGCRFFRIQRPDSVLLLSVTREPLVSYEIYINGLYTCGKEGCEITEPIDALYTALETKGVI